MREHWRRRACWPYCSTLLSLVCHDRSEGGEVMDDPVGDIIGDYRGFAAMQHERLLARGIDIGP